MTKVIFTSKLALQLWEQALEAEYGLVIEIDPADLDLIKQIMYKARKDSGNEELDRLLLHVNITKTVITIKPRLHNALP